MSNPIILRVFPRRTSYTPTDELALVIRPDSDGNVQLPLIGSVDEIHISVTFTWDKEAAHTVYEAFLNAGYIAKLGGPAYGDRQGFPAGKPSLYLKPNVTMTSQGCPMGCEWCLVPSKLRLIEDFHIAPIIQDDNLLAAGKDWFHKVIKRLRHVKQLRFVGGLDTRFFSPWHALRLSELSIKELWFAFDTQERLGGLGSAAITLQRAGFTRNQLRCYVLIGYSGDPRDDIRRLRTAWQLGFLPFAQLYQPPSWYIHYTKQWKKLARRWSRPAIIKRRMQ